MPTLVPPIHSRRYFGQVIFLSNPCWKFVNHYFPVVDLFAVNNKPAIADSMKKAG